jgi:hypothetical protein
LIADRGAGHRRRIAQIDSEVVDANDGVAPNQFDLESGNRPCKPIDRDIPQSGQPLIRHLGEFLLEVVSTCVPEGNANFVI